MSKFRLDEVDHQILDMLIDNTRIPFMATRDSIERAGQAGS